MFLVTPNLKSFVANTLTAINSVSKFLFNVSNEDTRNSMRNKHNVFIKDLIKNVFSQRIFSMELSQIS